MPRAKRKNPGTEIDSYRHAETRVHIPPAGLAGQGKVKEVPLTRYYYDPHLPPVLRFDEDGQADRLPELLEKAKREPLTDEEVNLLAEALRNQQPWLEWAGKREKRWFDVDPVALHIHERVSAQAILKLAQRQPLQRSLFADPELEYREAVQFYQHQVDWTNRLILGDSLTVMHSLAKREDLAGKVQMIYLDPPYGINFRSNFQPFIKKKAVTDREADLTREPEQVKAYRDTWTLGIHSYLAYLRDRLIAARELLSDSGSIFVQIGDENAHRVRAMMDEVFGPNNFCSIIPFAKTSGLSSKLLYGVCDFLLWYAKNKDVVKYHQLYHPKIAGEVGAAKYERIELPTGERRSQTSDEKEGLASLPSDAKFVVDDNLTSQGNPILEFEHQGKKYSGTYKTNLVGLRRLANSNRLYTAKGTLRYVRKLDDFPVVPLNSAWMDIGGVQSRADPKIYAVQTSAVAIQRCMLMTTDPGDLILDPTGGSGTTAYVAEQWGRRWIIIDTSRVAVALARQRLLTARFDYYELAHSDRGVSGNFVYKTVPHISLKSIAQNQVVDSISAKYEPILADKLAALNTALRSVTPEVRTQLKAKLADKEKREGKKAITEADQRRWLLPNVKWAEWEVPFEADPDWPAPLREALEAYRQAWRQKMAEVNTTIAASAPQETLVDQPQVVRNVLRVSGPFTVEGVQPSEERLDLDSPIGGQPDDLDTFSVEDDVADDPANADAYLEKMIRLLRRDGVRFPNNKVLTFKRLEPIPNSILHAEGEWGNGALKEGQPETRWAAVSFGPQYGPITAKQVEDCLWTAGKSGYDDLIFAGFSIDGAAQALIQEDPNPRVRCHLAHIRPDVNMGDLLKDTPGSQLFTVFGLPRLKLEAAKNGEYRVEMEGVDIYDPVTNTIRATKADKVAAWFLDSDYDGRTFCLTQAFFPDSNAWDKLAKALKSVVDASRFAAFAGTRSLPFRPGENKRIAVKVIDPRGNEVMRVLTLPGETRYG